MLFRIEHQVLLIYFFCCWKYFPFAFFAPLRALRETKTLSLCDFVPSCFNSFALCVKQKLRAFVFQILRVKNNTRLNNPITKKIIQLRKVLFYTIYQLALLHDIPTKNFGFNGCLQYRIPIYKTRH